MRDLFHPISYRALLLSVLWIMTCPSTYGQEKSLPQFPTWMVEKRMEALNSKTTIQLDYNQNVQAYIDVYTIKRRGHLANIISLSKLYFPLFEEYLDKYNLPLELKYLAVIESALDPRAKSKSGAKGLWQFLYHTGSMFDLKVTTYVDERSDPILATEAACRYLEYLYRIFDDWQLALAAYNGGAGVVKKAIERSGGKTDYWELRPYLPEQVKGYVPAFIAANYAIEYHSNYDIEARPSKFNFNQLDTVFVHQTLSFNKISEVIGIDLDDLTFLNPAFTKQTIPPSKEPICLFLPTEYANNFVRNEPRLYNFTERTPADKQKSSVKSIHIVKKGEYFHKIAIQHACTIEDIMKWNNMKNKDLHPGQPLTIWKKQETQKFFFIKDEFDNLAEAK
ncbi:lytic transglycosylase domain-containing protein [Saccharicrinis fermentans]|uniref:Membrane-bound lytic murein transglycosylase D n=1 Tax=Saccharicrinis fermentans DSM 9555 = JCM 21142 TaxID=869213 RepID=W7YKY2_9BACT|nr:lytic transglycosylase domain-containing protein [Saccharicrinis fermentans]GAF05181.1 membrane-bound lytic murein transglycosylase D precursor [Saccharicrinis fermentans DSM 9555 = JCM 21142]